MGFGNLWPLGLLILVPILIILYLLKQEAVPTPFSSTLLWKEVFENLQATKPWEKLKKSLLLFLQILIVLFLVIGMMGPWLKSLGKTQSTVILAIDNSASMASLYEGDTTRLEAAKKAACDYVDSLDYNTPVDLISCSNSAVLLVSSSTDKTAVKRAIKGIQQTDYAGTMGGSLGLVSSCLSAVEDGDTVFFTDTAFDLGNLDAAVESFYSATENVSLDAVNYGEKEDSYVFLASATNHGQEEVSVEINLYGVTSDGSEKLLDILPLTIEAGDSQSSYLDYQGDLSTYVGLRGEINEKDALADDNSCACAISQTSARRILLLTKSNLFLEKALGAVSSAQVTRTDDLSVVSAGESYDLYIFDGMVPDSLPEGGSFWFINCQEEGYFTQTGTADSAYLTVQTGDMTSYLSADSLGVNSTKLYSLPSWGTSIFSYGDSSAGFYGTYDGHRMAVTGFDFHSTDYCLTADFPVLVAGLSDYLLSASLLEENSLTLGESILLHGQTTGGDLLITAPDGSEQTITADQAMGSYFCPDQLGLYQICQDNGENSSMECLAVEFPTDTESQVSSAQTMLEGEDGAKTIEKARGVLELRKYLLWAVLVLLVLEGLVYFRIKRPKKLGRREAGALALRLLVFGLILAASFGPAITYRSDVTTTIFLVDMSDSTKGAQQDEIDFVREAISQMPDKKNQCGIVVFGADTKIEQLVTDKKAFSEVESQVVTTATDYEQAISTALALFPEETGKRMVLLTDGAENSGNITNVVNTCLEKNLECKVVSYETQIQDEVYVSNVSVPDTIHEGDAFQVDVEIYSTSATTATVSLYSGRTLKAQESVVLQSGTNHLAFSDMGVESGLKSYKVTVEATDDTVSVNNSYSAFTTVESQPIVLLVEGSAGESSQFQKVLDAANYVYEVATPDGVPNTINDMLRYKSVILLDVYADDLRSGFMDTLQTYVEDYAGGLVCIGGENAYALGQYRDTPLEEILPVKMDLEGEEEIPSIAMVMVIDHSGSMDMDSNANSSYSCLDVAKQAAVNALDSLREIDQVGVIAFDDTYDWAVPLQDATDLDGITAKIGSISIGGGTSIYPALEAAMNSLEDSDAAVKHIVLLTDGEDSYNYSALADDMVDQGITLSCVAIGSGADAGTLQDLADKCGGRYYYSDAGTSLPRIFAQEVYLSTDSYLINEEFTPAITSTHQILQGVFDQGSPSLLGYVATTPKNNATVILSSDRADPILALWQCGLGRTVAWTSDGSNQWTGNFAQWDAYPTLWKNILDWSITNTDLGDDTISIQQTGSTATLTYTTQDYTSASKISAILTDEDGNQQEVTLKPSTPGTFTAQVPLSETGVYSVSLRNQEGEEVVKSINTATAMQYSQEYRFADVTDSFQQFIPMVNGKVITSPEEVFDTRLESPSGRVELTMWLLLAAAFLFLLDVLVRRWNLDYLGAIGGFFSGFSSRRLSRKEKRKQKKEARSQQKQQAMARKAKPGQMQMPNMPRQAMPMQPNMGQNASPNRARQSVAMQPNQGQNPNPNAAQQPMPVQPSQGQNPSPNVARQPMTNQANSAGKAGGKSAGQAGAASGQSENLTAALLRKKRDRDA